MTHRATSFTAPAKADELSAIAALLAAGNEPRNGDDAAIVHIPAGLACLTTDTAVEGIHLDPLMSPSQMGYRAAACALSDIAAMAALPEFVLCSVSVPDGAWDRVVEIMDGVRTRCKESRCSVVGGDLVAAPSQHWSITVTCMGTGAGLASTEVATPGYLTRAGARAGHILCVTGPLGRAAAGLARLRQGEAATNDNAYLSPPNRIEAARVVAPFASAALDISDGIAIDACRLADLSGCGFQIDVASIPFAEADEPYLQVLGDPAEIAATWGDDYELLLAIPENRLDQAKKAVDESFCKFSLMQIGFCTDSDCTFSNKGQTVHFSDGFVHGKR